MGIFGGWFGGGNSQDENYINSSMTSEEIREARAAHAAEKQERLEALEAYSEKALDPVRKAEFAAHRSSWIAARRDGGYKGSLDDYLIERGWEFMDNLPDEYVRDVDPNRVVDISTNYEGLTVTRYADGREEYS